MVRQTIFEVCHLGAPLVLLASLPLGMAMSKTLYCKITARVLHIYMSGTSSQQKRVKRKISDFISYFRHLRTHPAEKNALVANFSEHLPVEIDCTHEAKLSKIDFIIGYTTCDK
jgi:hypothetical protein